MKKYNVILADPPWSFRAWSSKGMGRSAEQHYPTMRLEDIKALPVFDLAAGDCVLFLWATFPMLKEALEVIDTWGFTYKTVAFTWVKENRKSPGLFWGLGYWTRANAEVCLLATRGSPKRQSAAVHQVILSPVERHSKKPDEVQERIVTLMGDVSRVELFARQETPGWDVWGNEVECSPGLASRLTISPQQD
ncbi:adenine methyltransferase [bacterium 1xD42-67]|nr:adenine methyltransferase [bacterium 1xD42-67]